MTADFAYLQLTKQSKEEPKMVIDMSSDEKQIKNKFNPYNKRK